MMEVIVNKINPDKSKVNNSAITNPVQIIRTFPEIISYLDQQINEAEILSAQIIINIT